MKIETISVKEIKNLGNYQSITFEATALLQSHDVPEVKAAELLELVKKTLYPEAHNDENSNDTGF